VRVAILVRGLAVFVDRVDGNDSGLYRGAQHTEPALQSAAGRVLAARNDDVNWQLACERVDDVAAKEASDERHEWSRQPYLMTRESASDPAPEIAVPVIDGSGTAAAALATQVAADAEQSRIDAVIEGLTRVAQAAGRTLGHG